MSTQLDYEPDIQSPDQRPGDYFVSAIDAGKYALLSGPYKKHEDALADVVTVKRISDAHDGRAHWWSFGTCRLEPKSGRVGTLQKHNLHTIK